MNVTDVRLKDGRTVAIREFRIEDKEKLVEMYSTLSDEALRWGMPPYTREVIERWIANLPNLIIIIALCEERIVGHAHILKLPRARRKGTGDLIIYLHQDFHSVGLGAAMLKRILELARKEGLHRIGLSVITDNERAVNLYKKFGFKIEGIMKDAYFGEDAKYHDQLVMGLILANSTNPNQVS